MGLAPAQTRTRSLFWRALPTAVVIGAMLLGAALALPRLDNHLFWDDEANTAIYARNLLRFGRITAWDGTNLVGYGFGGALGEDLGQELRVPTLPAYVAAASMGLFGETTSAARLPFALAGVISVGLLAVWLHRHLGRGFPAWLPSLLLAASPAMLLYMRNCRYYSLGVMFSLMVWSFWAPGSSRRGPHAPGLLSRGALLRYVGAVVSLVLLLGTHYLNAAALLATLPLFFADRRYRQGVQYVMLAMLLATAVLYGLWTLSTIDPFAADYRSGQEWLFAPPPLLDRWTRFSCNLWWFLRDLGTHEFLAWLLMPVLALPLVAPWCARAWASLMDPRPSSPAADPKVFATALTRKARRLAPLAWRGAILLAILMTYILLACVTLPPDMGKGPTAETRYVIPVIAIGSVLAGLALVILWRLLKPLAVVVAILLLGTNWLYLGFAIDRLDRASPWWPPTLYRHVFELCHDFPSGNESLVDLLGRLPPGTSVRIWPSFMAYPPMFYVPELHYCDQLTETKPIREDLLPLLPDYLFVERAQPDVVIVPAPLLALALQDLDQRYGGGKYRLQKALREHFNYMSKPEIPNHCFWPPEGGWTEFPGMVVLVRLGSPLEKHPALCTEVFDEFGGCEAHYQAGYRLAMEGKTQGAISHYTAALRLNPRHMESHESLGLALEALGRPDEAARHYREALAIYPAWGLAHYNLAHLLAEQGENEEAETHYLAALAAQPNYPQAHVNLANLLLARGKTAEAREHLTTALRLVPPDSPLARKIRKVLRQLG